MIGNILRLGGGPLGLVVIVAELVLAACKLAETLKDTDDEEDK